jgi:hypothetical protein
MNTPCSHLQSFCVTGDSCSLATRVTLLECYELCWENPLHLRNGLFNSCTVVRGCCLYYFLNETLCIIWHVSCGAKNHCQMMIFKGRLMGTWQVGEGNLGYDVSREGLGRQCCLSRLLLVFEFKMASSLLRNCSRPMCSGNTVRGLHLLHQSEAIRCSKKLDV